MMSQLAPENLHEQLSKNPAIAAELGKIIQEESVALFAKLQPIFLESLDPFNRAVYKHCQDYPYASKDWYRDPHDIYVTAAMQRIISDDSSIPAWLVTAAILHDRGYAILAHNSQLGEQYLQRSGAHWENPETRTRHSLLSRLFAEEHLFESDRFKHLQPNIDRELFLEVIEKHDHALIEQYDEIPEVGRHHFDADSLFSISLMSFVKDYLSYLADPVKLEKGRAVGVFEGNNFTAENLLAARAARYFSSANELPDNWKAANIEFNPDLAKFNETGRCIGMHSITAQKLAKDSFGDLVDCCQFLREARTTESFREWFKCKIEVQFQKIAGMQLKNLNICGEKSSEW